MVHKDKISASRKKNVFSKDAGETQLRSNPKKKCKTGEREGNGGKRKKDH